MAYAEPKIFESNFAKKMDGLLNEALSKCITVLKGFGVFSFNLSELFYSEEINTFLHNNQKIISLGFHTS